MNTEAKQKNFEFPSRIKVPQVIPHFLEGNDAEAFLDEYNGIVEKDYNNNENLKVLSLGNINNIPTIIGSNTFAAVLVNKILENQGLRVATLSDIERTLEDGDTLNIKGNYYVDLGVVLRSRGDPNKYLAGNIESQVKNIGINLSSPLVIPAYSMRLVNDKDSNYKLAFELKENAEIIEAQQLIGANHGKKFLKANEKGLPVFDKKGDRTLYSREDGLSGLDLDGGFSLFSGSGGLAGSGEGGRVVVVNGEAASQNFSGLENYIFRLQAEKAKEIKGIESRYEAALRILKGN